MQTIHGSMRHDIHGRKRKNTAWKTTRKSRPQFEELRGYSLKTGGDHREKYPSMDESKSAYRPNADTSYKLEESKNFTVAPAYNKGAYQVIPQGDLDQIGK